MRQSQKTEQLADHLSKIDLEDRTYTGARSIAFGDNQDMDVTLQDLVLDRNNLNRAYLQVKKNRGAAGIDGMTVDEIGRAHV